jgi:hypothetical protein
MVRWPIERRDGVCREEVPLHQPPSVLPRCLRCNESDVALDGRDIALIAVVCDEIFFWPGRNRDQACGLLPARGRAVIQTAGKHKSTSPAFPS